jgi:hypothetical protein
LTEQGLPPPRSSRQPDLGRRGYNRLPDADYPPSDQPLSDGPLSDGPLSDRPLSDRPRSDRVRADRPRADRPRRAERADRPAGRDQFSTFSDTDADLPPWAGPAVQPTRPARPAGTRLRAHAPAQEYERTEYADPWEGDEPPVWPEEDIRPPEPEPPPPSRRRRAGRRAAAARLRKSRRRVVVWGTVAIVACVAAAGIAMIVLHKSTPKLPYVTSLLKGEFKSVPDACTAVSPAVLSQYLPGVATTVQPQSGPTDSQCTFTVDKKPDFLVLTVGAQSYQPFAAASGNGSASQNALDNLRTAQALLAKPTKGSALPKATISPLNGIGQHGFVAIQAGRTGGIAMDLVTVAVVDRNVIIIVSESAQESRGYGPVGPGTLEANGQAIAGAVLRKALTEPTA